MKQKGVLLVIGTRPDTIKLLPLYRALKKRHIPTFLLSTGQHADLIAPLLKLFHVSPDFDFRIMKADQDLFDTTSAVLQKSKELLRRLRPNLVVVQGDTTSALSAAIAAFYLKIPIAHVEAGLRSGNIDRPFPEEMNRRAISLLAKYHFAPTLPAVAHLLSEGVAHGSIYCTGNTIVDALYQIQEQMADGRISPSPRLIHQIASLKKRGRSILLLTAHRRESFDQGLARIFSAIHESLQNHPKLHVIYPIHPNPAIQRALKETKLSSSSRMHILKPLPYQDLIYVLQEADLIATDSGGIQEEGASLGQRVIVLREETDRPEGNGQIVGTSVEKIVSSIAKILSEKRRRKAGLSPYGDGKAAEKIAKIIETII